MEFTHLIHPKNKTWITLKYVQHKLKRNNTHEQLRECALAWLNIPPFTLMKRNKQRKIHHKYEVSNEHIYLMQQKILLNDI